MSSSLSSRHPPTIAAIVLAAGSGSRAGGDLPKQFRLLNGKPVLAWSVAALLGHEAVSHVVIVAPPGDEPIVAETLGPLATRIHIIAGGNSRRQSVRNALEHFAHSPEQPDQVFVHDSARPGLAHDVIDRLTYALESASAAIPVLPVIDTLIAAEGTIAGEVTDRSVLRRVQTPQAFRFQQLLAAHRRWTGDAEPTDDAQMLRALGEDVLLVEGDAMLEKITLPGDHERLERQLAGAAPLISRIGMGFDVHRLEADAPLWLCGVQIPHSHGLSGHSDADVAIHALVDAILGALAEGDIGSHFPPSDPQWRGASSDRFLTYAVERVTARGGIIDHIDVTIICEAPKIGPHRDAMRHRLSEIMGLSQQAISVKATTTEKLGLTGRGEGIAAQVVASLRLP